MPTLFRLTQWFKENLPLVMFLFVLSLAGLLVGLSLQPPTNFPLRGMTLTNLRKNHILISENESNRLSDIVGETLPVRISHYWPPLGGVNCFLFVGGECVSKTASGERWQDWVNKGAACPSEWPFWTKFMLPGGEWFACIDRGGKIDIIDGIAWVDLLVYQSPVPFGTVIQVNVVWPP